MREMSCATPPAIDGTTPPASTISPGAHGTVTVINCPDWARPKFCVTWRIVTVSGVPAGPVGPVGPVSPVAPVTPGGPVAPGTPGGPSSPVGPVAPTGPTEPTEPAGPAGPGAPAAPGRPSVPGGPAGQVGGHSGLAHTEGSVRTQTSVIPLTQRRRAAPVRSAQTDAVSGWQTDWQRVRLDVTGVIGHVASATATRQDRKRVIVLPSLPTTFVLRSHPDERAVPRRDTPPTRPHVGPGDAGAAGGPVGRGRGRDRARHPLVRSAPG